MKNLVILVLAAGALSGCACLQDKPALRTALIATGAAVLGGAIAHRHSDDQGPTPHFHDPDCKHKDDCR